MVLVPANDAKLSARDRQQLAAWLDEFGRTWRPEAFASLAGRLPPHEISWRASALLGAVAIDLRRQWEAGRPMKVEAYLVTWPELGDRETVPVDLVHTEFELRQRFAAPADAAEFARRFPSCTAELQRRIAANSAAGSTKNVGSAPHTTTVLPSTEAAVPQLLSTPAELPKQFGRYQIEKRLGRGGMGSVYLAHDAELDRQVALKVPILEPGDGAEVLQRFQREARAAATIDHPNVCPIYDVGTIAGIPYVTMAYIEGRPLSELLRAEKRLPQRPVAAVARKLALAMQAAHSRGVIHRDLKPANVMINKRNEPVVMDFGLARRANQDVRLTVSGAILGTPAYMSPEQARGDESGVASDIYSLGVILYEMLTGRLPFKGDVQSVLVQIISQPPDPLAMHNPEVEPALATICLKALAKQPCDRYRSMQELAGALGDYLKGVPAKPEAAPRGGSAPGSPPPPPAGISGDAAGATTGGAGQTGEGLATQLLAKLAERLESPPPPSATPPPKASTAQWIAVMVGALTLVALVFIAAAMMGQKPPEVTVEVRLQEMVPAITNPIYITVLLDGEAISPQEISQPRRMTSGKHVVQLQRRDGTTLRQEFEIAATQTESKPLKPPPGSDDRGQAGFGAGSIPKGTAKQDLPAEFDRAQWVECVTWDIAALEDQFKVLKCTYNDEANRVEWLLEAKGPTNFSFGNPYQARFYDDENVASEPVSLNLMPSNAEQAGDHVRASVTLQKPAFNPSQDPLRKIVKVVISDSKRSAGKPGSGS